VEQDSTDVYRSASPWVAFPSTQRRSLAKLVFKGNLRIPIPSAAERLSRYRISEIETT
jgi:hypothetical protein